MIQHLVSSLSAETIYAVVGLIVFLESAIVFFFFLPGDSLLFSLGIYISYGLLDAHVLLPVLIVAAILGNLVGYWLGKYFGQKWIQVGYTKYIKPEYFRKSEKFFSNYGSVSVFLSRFVPIVRTIMPFLAGIASMKKNKFTVFSIVGGVVWVSVVVSVGYFFGNTVSIANVEKFVLLLMLFVIFIVPFIMKYVKKYIFK